MYTILWQWAALISQVVAVFSIADLLERVVYHAVTVQVIERTILILVLVVIIRFICEWMGARSSYLACVDVKRILREKIYEKMLKMGASYSEQVSSSEVVQKIAKKLLNKYWSIYTGLGDSFLENLQGLTTLKIYQADKQKADEMEAVLQKVNLLGFLQTQDGLQTKLLEKASNLSGGQCQRLVIARALLRTESAVYIFDEAASNIDVESEELMRQNGEYRHLYESQMALENYGKPDRAGKTPAPYHAGSDHSWNSGLFMCNISYDTCRTGYRAWTHYRSSGNECSGEQYVADIYPGENHYNHNDSDCCASRSFALCGAVL